MAFNPFLYDILIASGYYLLQLLYGVLCYWISNVNEVHYCLGVKIQRVILSCE